MRNVSINNILYNLHHNLIHVKKNVMEYKLKFCNNFEEEYMMERGNYSEIVFDYLFNLYTYRKYIEPHLFKKIIDEFYSLDLKKSKEVGDYISKKYIELLVLFKKNFMDHFRLNHDDELYIQRKIENKRDEFRDKLVNFY